MRLIPRHRHNRRTRSPQIEISEAEISADPQIEISEAEISADLHYPAPQRRAQYPTVVRRIEVR